MSGRDRRPDGVSGQRARPGDRDAADEDPPDMDDLLEQFDELAELADTPEERERVRETMRVAVSVTRESVLGRVVHGFDVSDAAEALLGALVFGIPMFVESGTQEIGEFVAGHTAYFLLTNALAIALVVGILYVADIQDVQVRNPLLGLLPRKPVGVLSIAFLTAVFMMTAWGRVDWGEPWLAICTVSVAFVPMAIGAALGDILPG